MENKKIVTLVSANLTSYLVISERRLKASFGF
ncbi:hypothetical protein HNQ94_000241 [Salirhabdus euzebyi]|uniref:Uncharacterized protein n=1 Tax=Salirhabdus euzebyi TaxID=394506 RepID=A0A841PSQ6_9BACI|nr:hypothetical protein [Salirhabdus euzebyi]